MEKRHKINSLEWWFLSRSLLWPLCQLLTYFSLPFFWQTETLYNSIETLRMGFFKFFSSYNFLLMAGRVFGLMNCRWIAESLWIPRQLWGILPDPYPEVACCSLSTTPFQASERERRQQKRGCWSGKQLNTAHKLSDLVREGRGSEDFL